MAIERDKVAAFVKEVLRKRASNEKLTAKEETQLGMLHYEGGCHVCPPHLRGVDVTQEGEQDGNRE